MEYAPITAIITTVNILALTIIFSFRLTKLEKRIKDLERPKGD